VIKAKSFIICHSGEYRVVYLTPEYVSLDTGFLAHVQKSVGEVYLRFVPNKEINLERIGREHFERIDNSISSL